MTQPIELRNEIFAVEIPDDAKDVRMNPHIHRPIRTIYADCDSEKSPINPEGLWWEDLPEGSQWQLIGLSDEITEEQAKEIVEIGTMRGKYRVDTKLYEKATTAFKSLLRSKNLSKRYALLKKIK